MEHNITGSFLQRMLGQRPEARAEVWGAPDYPDLHGWVSFWQTNRGVLVAADIHNLPNSEKMHCNQPFFAFHIHEGQHCSGNEKDPFVDALGHFNPGNCPHPEHGGDLPPLLISGGGAWMAVLTDRFHVQDVIGRTVIVHRQADDFMTQPSGASGAKIACGQIQRMNRR